MATAKAQAAESKKKQVVKRKAKEVAPSSSSEEESDFDDEEDPDSIQVPGGGKDLKTLSQISSDVKPSVPTLSTSGNDTLILPSKPVAAPVRPVTRPPIQPGYEVIRIQPGTNPFSMVGLRPNASVMQQAIALVKSNVPGGAPIRVNVPISTVQSLLRNRAPGQIQVNLVG